MSHGRVSIEMLLATLMVTALHPADITRADQQQFETEVRPLLIDHCLKCHGPDKQEGGLRLDSADGLNRGGDSGAVVTPDRPTESLLWQRVAAGEMPPATEPRLTAREQQSLRKWIESGAEMPARALDLAEAKDWRRLWSFHSFKQNSRLTPTSANVTPKEAQQSGTGWNPVLRNLKAWYRASDLKLSEWGEVNRWPDRSGQGRDLLATRGAHVNGLGGPAYYMPASSIARRPAVRFVESSGFGSPGDNPVEIQGNAGFSLVMVCRLQPRTGSYPHDLLLSVGEFSFPDDPGRPLAAALGIQRAPGADHRLSFVGGWGHDGHLAPGSFARLYFQTCVITLVKTPGAVAQTTNLFINGVPSSAVPALGKITGSEAIPDYQPRQSRDFSVMLGNAVGGAGGFAGDVAEVLVYSAPLTDEERMQTETGLMREYVEFPSGSSPQTTNEPHGSNRLTPDPGSLHADLIDGIIDQRLNAEQLAPAPPASRATLMRRASFDLLGLPPTPEQIDKFVNDTSPNAWESALIELLASPHYGERWGRHWLDVARYADSGGYETDILYRQAWRYRDYVVKSLNDDKPFDRFVQEQIAGDELWPDNLDTFGPGPVSRAKERALEAHLGTGLFVLGPQIHESNADAPLREYERLTDQVDLLGSVFLGLTLGCARCHDHKFDPLTQRDYFSLQAVFAHSREGERVLATASDIADMRQHHPRVQAVLRAKRAYRLFEQSLAGRAPTSEEETQRQRLLGEIGQRVLEIPETSAQGKAFDGLLEIPTALVLEHQRPELVKPVHWLARGELNMPRDRMDAGLPVSLAEATKSPRDLPDGLTSRRDLAIWLTRPDHPLTARVIVNRVWQWHVGTGLVSTPNDFGRMGQPPSHPELLDWLAVDFVAHGWSLKRLHLQIMTTRAYQRDSKFATPRHLEVDPESRLLWRFNRRRLEGEIVWDALHSVAGTINLEQGGPPMMPPITDEERSAMREPYRWQESPDPRQHARRGLYVMTYRNFRYPLFDVFDAPNNSVSVGSRDVSTVAPQALWLLNHPVAWQQAQRLAERVERESPTNTSDRINRLWRLTLQRLPTGAEQRSAERLLAGSTSLAQLSLTLFNHNGFLFVD